MRNIPDPAGCPNSSCPSSTSSITPKLIRHSFLKTRAGWKQRWRCKHCGRTFTRKSGTPYHRLQASPAQFDRAIKMCVEGSSKAAIGHVLGVSRKTVGRWIERAASYARTFSDRLVRDVKPLELQADEVRGYKPGRSERTYVFSVIDVWSRLWLSQKVGNRTYRNCRVVMQDARRRCKMDSTPVLIVTDRFRFYSDSVWKAWGPSCVHVLWRKKLVDKRVVMSRVEIATGTAWQLQMALDRSEDSNSINTAFVERLNLFTRRSLNYLHRRTQSIAQRTSKLAEAVDLLQCYYNFVRPHGSLKFGREKRTPGQQAGLVRRRLTFRDVFLSFKAGARVRWIADEKRRSEWGISCTATTVLTPGGPCRTGPLPCGAGAR
jgi:transposase-like protein/IS1 family transposase